MKTISVDEAIQVTDLSFSFGRLTLEGKAALLAMVASDIGIAVLPKMGEERSLPLALAAEHMVKADEQLVKAGEME